MSENCTSALYWLAAHNDQSKYHLFLLLLKHSGFVYIINCLKNENKKRDTTPYVAAV